MPIYEYKCPKCGDVSEHLQGYDDPAPDCEKKECVDTETKKPIKTQRMISQTSFQLKGGGWAKDGYGG